MGRAHSEAASHDTDLPPGKWASHVNPTWSLANPMYLPEGGKPPHLPMFEIRAAYVGRTISFLLLSLLSRSHQPPLSRTAARVSRPEELGEGERVEGPLARGGW